MSGDFLSRIMFTCRHQFSWPRRDDNGEYYQLCVHCGAKYMYDWARMRRLSAVEDEPETTTNRMRHCGKKVAWTPRERRLKHEVPLTIRVDGSEARVQGTTQNISRSGLLFESPASFVPGTKLELEFEMPSELTGEKSALVVCHAVVARILPDSSPKQKSVSTRIACSISGYDFMEESKIEPVPETVNVVDISKRKRHA